MAFGLSTVIRRYGCAIRRTSKWQYARKAGSRLLYTSNSLPHKEDDKLGRDTQPQKPMDKFINPSMNRPKTPIGKLDEIKSGIHPHAEKEPLKPWPENTNPNTGEVGGPKGPEPTRYGDWERKGKVSDF